MQPFVSIILPVRNESKFIIPCLRSIAAQDYPKEQMELLIVDGRSTDSMALKIEKFRIQNSEFRIHLVDNPARTVPHAMNLGISKARGDILLRFDGHALMARDYVSNCVKFLEQTHADNVGGPAQNITDGTITGQSIAMSHNSAFGLGGGAFRMGNYEGFTDTVTFGCFPKETFAKYGLYDTRLTRNQDIELNARIRKGLRLFPYSEAMNLRRSEGRKAESTDPSTRVASKCTQDDMAGVTDSKVNSICDVCAFCGKEESPGPGKIYLTPKIKSHYHCRSTLSGLWSQNFKNGQWVVYTKYIAPYALSLRHFIPLIFITSLILLACLIRLSAGGWGYVIWGHGDMANFLIRGMKDLGLVKLPGLFSLKVWCWHLLFIRLLVLELFAYFSAMLFFILQSGKHKHKTDSSDSTASGKPQNDTPDKDSIFSIQNSEFKVGSLVLLPVVFLTLHFSYGLGSLWGLATLPFWLGTNRTRIDAD